MSDKKDELASFTVSKIDWNKVDRQRDAWDLYASAALSGALAKGMSEIDATYIAALCADRMMHLREAADRRRS